MGLWRHLWTIAGTTPHLVNLEKMLTFQDTEPSLGTPISDPISMPIRCPSNRTCMIIFSLIGLQELLKVIHVSWCECNLSHVNVALYYSNVGFGIEVMVFMRMIIPGFSIFTRQYYHLLDSIIGNYPHDILK